MTDVHACSMIEVINGIRQRVDHLAIESIPELSGRLDAVAHDRDAHAKTMQEILQQFELIAIALEQNSGRLAEQLSTLSETIGRIGVRRIGVEDVTT